MPEEVHESAQAEEGFDLRSMHTNYENNVQSLEVYDLVPTVWGRVTDQPPMTWRDISRDYYRLPNVRVHELYGPIFTGQSMEYASDERRFYVYRDDKKARVVYGDDTILSVRPAQQTDERLI